ncbi:MAG TPA: HD domain-containing phosphohydrolase [Candidatus Limnocylindrales bacterium]|jgi:putative two-component system response regulator
MTWELRLPHPGKARPRVLCVDDEPVILQIQRRLLEVQGFEAVVCNEPQEAVASFGDGDFDVVITDIHMPGMDGLALMRALRERQPDLPVVVVTGHGTVDTAIQALREGATGMLVKPFTGAELLAEVRRALGSAQMRYEALQYRYLSPVLDSIALTLSTAIEARNLETGEHCRQLGVLSERMAAVLGLDEHQQMTIRIGGYLHDIGKIGIADAVLLKPGPLTDAEMAEMRRHSEIGAAILEVHEAMADISKIVRHHHERWDGRGYPDSLAGTSIPLGGRIIAVADAYSAMTSDRIYRAALPVDRAWAELRAHSGTQFDPEIVAVFEQVVDDFGLLRPLDPGISRTLETEVHVPMVNSQEWRDRLAVLPVLEPLAVPVKTVPEPCPVAPEGEECAVIASGEGCEIVLADESPAPTDDGASRAQFG